MDQNKLKEIKAMKFDAEEDAQNMVDRLNKMVPPWSCPLVRGICGGVDETHPCVCFIPAQIVSDMKWIGPTDERPGHHEWVYKVGGFYCDNHMFHGDGC